MPDISKLPELAELFGISIDELLGKKSELISNIIEGDMEEFLGNTLVAAEELKEAAPILQPAQIERIVEDAKQEFELGEMTELLPFINQDTINKLAYRAEMCIRDRENICQYNCALSKAGAGCSSIVFVYWLLE